MMTIALSEGAKEILRAAGWYEGRRVDIRPIVAFVEQHGFSVFPVGSDFLSEFHGLKMRLSKRGGLSFIHFDVYEEVGWIEPGDKPFLDALVQAPLCPVGHGGGVLLFVTEPGEMVLLSDQWMGFSRFPSIAEGMDVILGLSRPPQYDGVALTEEQIPPGFR
jgi:SUKH-3 immunity protein